MKQDWDDIVFKLKEVRRKLKLTQEALAHRLGVSFTSVNRWENGQTQPSPLARKQIVELFESGAKRAPLKNEVSHEGKN